MRKIENIFYTEEKIEQKTLSLYLPDGQNFPILVYFHGGGFVGGDKNFDGDILAPALTERGIALVSANYRMYPEAKFPDFVEDAAEAVAWVKKNISSYGGSDSITVGGTSAGGYLSMMLCFADKYLGAHGLSATDFTSFIHDAGQATVHFNVLKERGLDPTRIIVDEAAPLWHIGCGKKYPPMLFIWSDNDIPCRAEELELVISVLKRHGHTELEKRIMHGTHVHYITHADENGKAVPTLDTDGKSSLGKIMAEYVFKKSNRQTA